MNAEQTAPARILAVTITLDDYYAFQQVISRPVVRAKSPREKLLLAGFWLLWAITQLLSRGMRARLAPAPDGVVLGDLRIELSEPRLRVVSRHFETLISWSAVRELRETPTHLFLMLDTASGYILPKRFLGDAAAIWALRSLLSQRITMTRSAR